MTDEIIEAQKMATEGINSMVCEMHWELCIDDVPQGKRFATLDEGKAHCEKFGYHTCPIGAHLENWHDDLICEWDGEQWKEYAS
jgi:hypothetical protein